MTPCHLALIAAALLASIAHAQARCVPRDVFVKMAMAQWEEQPVAAGFERDGDLMELLVSPKGTYTVILVEPRGDCASIAATGSGLMLTGEMPLGEPM